MNNQNQNTSPLSLPQTDNPLFNLATNMWDGLTEFAQDAYNHPHALVRGGAVGVAIGVGAASALTPWGGLILGSVIGKVAYNLNRGDEELNKGKSKLGLSDKDIAFDQFVTSVVHIASAGFTMITRVLSMDSTDVDSIPDPVPAAMALYYGAKLAYEPVAEHNRVIEQGKVQKALDKHEAETQLIEAYFTTPKP